MGLVVVFALGNVRWVWGNSSVGVLAKSVVAMGVGGDGLRMVVGFDRLEVKNGVVAGLGLVLGAKMAQKPRV